MDNRRNGPTIQPMLVTAHVASATVTSTACRTPAAGLAAGILSHLVLDAIPHWGARDEDDFERTAITDGLVALTLIAAILAHAPAHRRTVLGATIVGAVLPDLDKPIRYFTGREAFPRSLHRFLVNIQTESPRYVISDITTIIAGTIFGLRPR